MSNICVLHEKIDVRTGTKKCDNLSSKEVYIYMKTFV